MATYEPSWRYNTTVVFFLTWHLLKILGGPLLTPITVEDVKARNAATQLIDAMKWFTKDMIANMISHTRDQVRVK